MRVVVSLLVAASMLGACIPMRVSSRCRQQVSDCLDRCPPQPATTREDLPGTAYNDTRNTCEKICHEQANACERSESSTRGD